MPATTKKGEMVESIQDVENRGEWGPEFSVHSWLIATRFIFYSQLINAAT